MYVIILLIDLKQHTQTTPLDEMFMSYEVIVISVESSCGGLVVLYQKASNMIYSDELGLSLYRGSKGSKLLSNNIRGGSLMVH